MHGAHHRRKSGSRPDLLTAWVKLDAMQEDGTEMVAAGARLVKMLVHGRTILGWPGK